MFCQYLRFVVPNAAAASVGEIRVVAAFASVVAVAMVPHLLLDDSGERDRQTHPDNETDLIYSEIDKEIN